MGSDTEARRDFERDTPTPWPDRVRAAVALATLGLVAATVAVADTRQFTYDALGRLKAVTKSDGTQVTYDLDAAGNRTKVTVADIQPPSAPGTLSGTALSGTQISLSWGAAADNVGVTAYRVYRGGAVVASPGSTGYVDSGLSSAASYSYRVTALDAAGNESPSTNTVTIGTPDTVAPTAPAGLSTAVVSTSQINLSWAASSDNVGVAGYRVYRNGAGPIATPTTTSFSNTGLAAGTSYSYYVVAYDAAGNASGASTTSTATTSSGAATPTVPANIRVSPATGSTGTYSIAWDASSGATINHYTLLESRSAPTVGSTTYSNTTTSKTFAKGNVYLELTYQVRACSSADETLCSAWSSSVFKMVCPSSGCP